MLQLIPKIGRVPAQEERGDWADGGETGHGNRQVGALQIPKSMKWVVFQLFCFSYSFTEQ